MTTPPAGRQSLGSKRRARHLLHFKTAGAAIIRAVTWSDWSHVAIIDGEEVIEATWPAVRVVPLADVIVKHSRFVVADIPCQDPAAVIAAARSQIGKPYDLTAIFGMLARRDWQEADAWFCSELTAWAFQ